MFTLLLLFCIFFHAATANEEIEVFEKLNGLNSQWLHEHAIPEFARVLRLPPYSYHSNYPPSLKKSSGSAYNSSGLLEKYDLLAESKCADDLVQIFYHLKSSWALQMIDSDGKLSSGLLRGGIIWPGHFEECLSVYSPADIDGHGDFNGQYCVISWEMNLGKTYPKLPLTVGMCVPDTCSADELKIAGKNVFKILERLPVLKQFKSMLNLTNITCKEKGRPLDAASIVYLIFVFFFVILTVSGSVVWVLQRRQKLRQTTPLTQESIQDVCSNDKVSLSVNEELNVERAPSEEKSDQSILTRILLCFSAFENGKKIFNIKVSDGQLLSVHGIRFLSLTWVIIGHTYISSVSIIGNRLDVLKEMDNFPFQMLLQAPFSVDSFFLLSGFLLAYLFLKECDRRKGKINWIYFYVHRYWRLTPVYMMVVFFYTFLFKYLGSGPFWDDTHCDETRGYWWKYLLYINNFIPIKDMCLGWSWYLANDMQFYIISPLFLYPLWRWPPIGFSLLVSILIGTWTATGIISYQMDLIPMFVGVTQAPDFEAYEKKMWDSFDLIYDKPYCRIAPYILGVFLGYALFYMKDKKNFLNWWQQTLGWITALFCSLSVVFGLYHVQMSRTTAMFYNSLCRSSFSVGLAWLIFVCETGHGGFLAKLLSWKVFIPLSRLTFCAYLVHPILIHGYYQAHQAVIYFSELVMVTNFFGFLMMSFGIAFVVSIVFESPLMNLEKLLLKKREQKR